MRRTLVNVWNKSALLAACCLSPALVAGQALPTAPLPSTGFGLPQLNGEVSYAITASQTFQLGYNGVSGSNVASTNISGDVAYLSRNETHPFSLIYSGGFLGSESAQYPNSTFQNLAVSQVLRYRRNTVVFADTVSYLPQSPITGLSGIPGVGDLGVNPVQAGTYFTGPGILTQFQKRVSNYVSGSEIYDLSGKTSLHGTGSYGILRFLGDGPLGSNGGTTTSFDSDQFGGSGGFTHQIDRRNSYGASYVYSRFTYKDQPYTFSSSSILGEYTHHFTPNLVFNGSVGPQINSSSLFTNTATSVATLLSLTYAAQRSSYALSFSRGSNNGSGVVQGALSNSVGFTGQHRFGRSTSGAATISYTHSTSIPSLVLGQFSADSVVTGAQINQGLGRAFSVYGSYTLQRQSTTNAAFSTLAYNGLTQILGFGITYSPTSLHMGKH